MIEPRPCPFCASMGIDVQVDDGEDFRGRGFVVFRAICMVCFSTGPTTKILFKDVIWPIDSAEFTDHGIDAAIHEWNTRAMDPIGVQF